MTKNTEVKIRISEEDKTRLKALAESDNRTMSDWIVNQIRKEYAKSTK